LCGALRSNSKVLPLDAVAKIDPAGRGLGPNRLSCSRVAALGPSSLWRKSGIWICNLK